MTLELKRFDTSSITKTGKIIYIIGNGDKSDLVYDILYHQQDISIGALISGTEAGKEIYSELVPEISLHDEHNSVLIEDVLVPKISFHDEYNGVIIRDVIQRQRVVFRQMTVVNKEYKIHNYSDLNPTTLVLLDSCFDDTIGWTRDRMIRLLLCNSKSMKLFVVITMQKLRLPPNLRENNDYIFFLLENVKSDRETFYLNYADMLPMFPTFEVFCSVLDNCTENYDCLVIDKTKREFNIFWYKAEKRRKKTVIINWEKN
jgi:hypothetical protein